MLKKLYMYWVVPRKLSGLGRRRGSTLKSANLCEITITSLPTSFVYTFDILRDHVTIVSPKQVMVKLIDLDTVQLTRPKVIIPFLFLIRQ